MPAGANPVPARLTLCVPSASLIRSDPAITPTLNGVNVTCIAHEECAASVVPQPFDTAKSPLTMTGLMRVSGTPPSLRTEIVWAGLALLICVFANVSAVVERVSVAALIPVPPSAAVRAPASLDTVSVPLRVPEAVGLNTTDNVQLVFGASDAPQVFATILKSPVMEAAPSVPVVEPVFASVMFCTAEVLFKGIDPNISEDGVNTEAKPVVETPLPLTGAVIVTPPAGIENEADRGPDAVGVNAMVIAHAVLPARVAPQVFDVMEKSPPLMAGAPRGPTRAPVFAIFRVRATLVVPTRVSAKVSGEGASVGTKLPVPLPVIVPSSGPISELIVNPLVCVPSAVGRKTSENAHVAPGSSVAPHVFATAEKYLPTSSRPSPPEIVPAFVTVTVTGGLVPSTGVSANTRALLDRKGTNKP